MTCSFTIAFVLSFLVAARPLAADPSYPAALRVVAAEVAVAPTDDTLFGRGEQSIAAPAWDDPSSGDALR